MALIPARRLRRWHRRSALSASVAMAMVASLAAAPAALGAGATTSARTPASDFIGNNFFDECDDGGDFDIKKFSIIDNELDDLTYLWGTCPGSTAPADADSSVVFFIDDGGRPGTPSFAVVQSMLDASWVVFDTNRSGNEDDWDVVQEGVGSITRIGPDDGGPRDVGSIEIDALAADLPISYFVTVVAVTQDTIHDQVPESNMPPIHFPDGCDYFELHAARVRTSTLGGVGLWTAANALLGTRSVPRADGSRLAWPLDDVAVDALDALPGIEVDRPVMYRSLSDPEPTDWAVEQTRLDEAWQAIPRAAASIAVLDQGVDATRADLVGRIGAGFNALTGETFTAGQNSALGPHGTAVSGIAVATRDNGQEVAGVNDGATVVPVRVFDHANCADDTSIAAGLDWAVSEGVDIINLSLGGPGESDVLREAIERAGDAGAIILAATGNDFEVVGERPSYPAAYDEVIGIGATGPEGVADYSQSAATEFVAPGGEFSGRRESDFAILSEWNRVEYQAGTSFSAPFAAALVSLWLRDHPGATTSDVREALRAASVDLPGDRDGAGLVDAVLLLGDGTVPAVPPAPSIDGDPSTSHRLAQDEPIPAALAVSGLRFPAAGSAPVVVLARDDTFADALSGAALSRTGPVLFTRTSRLDVRVRDEILRVLAEDGTIYLLGGPNALATSIEEELAELLPQAEVKRLEGRDRFQTSRAIVEETVERFGTPNQILLARGFGPLSDPNGTAAWADAIAAAPFAASRGWPLLIVPSGGLSDLDVELIDRVVQSDGLINLLGGPNALQEAVFTRANTVRTTRRIWGANRDATAATIAGTLWGAKTTGPATVTLVNPYSSAGWYLGLASAGYAASINAPILTVSSSTIPDATAPWLERCGSPEVEVWVAGGTSQVSTSTLSEVDRRDGQTCAPS